jgi:hypothetical protein
MNDNYLDSTLPSDWGLLGSLEYLDLSQNYLTGTIPMTWGGMANLNCVSMSGTTNAGKVFMLLVI